MKRIIIFFVFCFVFFGCKKNHSKHYSDKYNIEINYYQNVDAAIHDKYRFKVNDDTLYIFFDYFFDNDTIQLYRNNKMIFKETLITDRITGLAKYLKIEKRNTQNIGIRINYGKKVFVEINQETKSNNLIQVIYSKNSKVIVNFIGKTPAYY